MYPSGGDDHPNAAGDRKATAEFLPLLNNAYNTWQATSHTITITAPTAASSWPSGSRQSVTWTMEPAVSTGEFRVGLVSAAGKRYINKKVLPVAGRTAYRTALRAAVPAAAGYEAYVYWRPAVGRGRWTAKARSAAFAVSSAAMPAHIDTIRAALAL